MMVKVVNITETDAELSERATNKRIARNKKKGIVHKWGDKPTIKRRSFAVQIGFMDETEVGPEEEDLIVEILDAIFKKELYHDIKCDSKWPPILEQSLAPVKANNPSQSRLYMASIQKPMRRTPTPATK
jgi:hypothetical protein